MSERGGLCLRYLREQFDPGRNLYDLLAKVSLLVINRQTSQANKRYFDEAAEEERGSTGAH